MYVANVILVFIYAQEALLHRVRKDPSLSFPRSTGVRIRCYRMYVSAASINDIVLRVLYFMLVTRLA